MITLAITGAINGTNGSDGNPVFTVSPNVSFLQLFRNGLLQTPNVSYLFTGANTVTFLAPYIPITGDVLIAEGDGASAGSIYVSDILYRAFRLSGYLGNAQRGISMAQAVDGLAILNAMLDQWNTERLIAYSIVRNVQNLTVNQQTYLIGSGAPDFNIPRPERIERAGLLDPQDQQGPLELPITILTTPGWASIPLKSVMSTIPLQLYYYPAFPFGQVNFWPIPSKFVQVALYLWQQLSQFLTVSDVVLLPPGYLKALQYNLAVEIGITPFEGHARNLMDPRVEQIAVEAREKIKSLNMTIVDANCDPAMVNTGGAMWDYRVGDWVNYR